MEAEELCHGIATKYPHCRNIIINNRVIVRLESDRIKYERH
jgi:hypothetical protein